MSQTFVPSFLIPVVCLSNTCLLESVAQDYPLNPPIIPWKDSLLMC